MKITNSIGWKENTELCRLDTEDDREVYGLSLYMQIILMKIIYANNNKVCAKLLVSIIFCITMTQYSKYSQFDV